MRTIARIDENQHEIVDALEAVGATVQSISPIGGGCPDLLVGFRGQNFVLEVKDGEKPLSRQRLTELEVEWHRWWKGQRAVVNNVNAALRVIGAVT